MAQIQIKQIKSKIGTKPNHRGSLRALGLTRISRVRIHEDNEIIRGMIARVPHLIEVSAYDPKSDTGKMAKPVPKKSNKK